MNIVSVGEITVDHYLRQERSLIGGISLNFAVHARRSGAQQVSLVSCVGDGPWGAWIKETLAREQVNSTHVAVKRGRTAEIDIEVYDNADRVFPPGGYRKNVLAELQLTDPVIEFVRQHDLVVTYFDGSGPHALVTQLMGAPTAGLKKVVDFGDWSNGRIKPVDPSLLNQLDLAFFSGDEEAIETVKTLTHNRRPLVVVSLGAAGSVVLTPSGQIFQAAVPVERPVDSTGCGDAFQAAFTVAYFAGGDLSNALQAGAERASGVLQHLGAFDQGLFSGAAPSP